MEQEKKKKKREINVESGFFLGKIPYLKDWTDNSTENLVIFPHTAELIQSLCTNPIETAALFRKYIPDTYTIYVLGYDRNLPMDHTSEQIGDEFAQIIREHIGPATIMAVSYGGFIGIPFAARYPELTKKLILLVSAYSGSEHGLQLSRELVQLAEDGDGYAIAQRLNGLFLNVFLRGLVKFLTWTKKKKPNPDLNPLSTFIHAYKHMIATFSDRKKYLPMIEAPTLVIGADQDQFFSEDKYRETAELIPDGRVVIFHSGHMVPVEKMGKVRESIHNFLLD
ncbi:MAG: alpha/beta fold hydrolase [Promethearchaeota archaeon]